MVLNVSTGGNASEMTASPDAVSTRLPISLMRLSKRHREETPLRFAEYLIALARPQAVLWVRENTVYKRWPGLDLWPASRDANRYSGPGRIIAHPPCGPWGKLAHLSNESKRHGINAMRFVHEYGGVVEQPEGSHLFDEWGRDGRIIWVNQFDYGHRAMKPTNLYVVD